MPYPNRRGLLAAGCSLATAALAGCAGSTRDFGPVGGLDSLLSGNGLSSDTIGTPDYKAIYGGIRSEQFPIAPFDPRLIDADFLRQQVVYPGSEPAGTVVVDPNARQLYFIEPDRRATRYGVGVGREGFGWSGRAQINMKRLWPDWIPPAEMVARLPDIRSQLVPTARGLGVPGGTRSPLGARAMYLFGDGRDLGYRIHGTLEPETIGTEVSSGCIRMINQDIIHLYARAPLGTRVVVLG